MSDIDITNFMPETSEQFLTRIRAEIKRDLHLNQLSAARLKRKQKQHGRRTYAISLGPVNERRKRIRELGFKKYDGRRSTDR